MAYSIAIDRTKCALIGAIFLLLEAGCARTSAPAAAGGCDATASRILQAVLDDGALRRYASAYLENEERLVLVWDDMPSDARACETDKRAFVLTRTSGLQALNRDRYIVVTKMYYDGDAAFVELMLYPTGMNGDFFLRNKGRWNVTQRSLWESKHR